MVHQIHYSAIMMVLGTMCMQSEATYAAAGATGYRCPTLFNYYGDVGDCSKFYRCVWGQAYTFNCPAGTRWSQALLTCDHSYNVPCSNDPGYLALPPSPKAVYADYEEDSRYANRDGDDPSQYANRDGDDPNQYANRDGDNSDRRANYYEYGQHNDGYDGQAGSRLYGSSHPTISYEYAPPTQRTYGWGSQQNYAPPTYSTLGGGWNRFAAGGFNGYGYGYGYSRGDGYNRGGGGYNSGYLSGYEPWKRSSFLAGRRQ